jgi:hypothetical protein
MTKGTSSLHLLILLAVAASLDAQAIYSDLRNHQYWFRTVLVPQEDFTPPRLERMARDFVNGGEPCELMVFSVFTSVDDAAMAVTRNHASYTGWKADFDAAGGGRELRVAELVAIGEDSVLRIRQADGSVLHKVLTGKNPLQFEVDGAAFEILIVQPRTGTRFDRCDPSPMLLSPVVRVKTSARLGPALCAKAATRIAELMRTRKLVVTFRNDHWFLGRSPLIYPFATGESPPTKEAYYNSMEFTCMLWCNETPLCNQTAGPP